MRFPLGRDDASVNFAHMKTEVTVWFDGDCPLCRREIALMRRLDRHNRITFIDVARPEASGCPLDRADLLARFHAQEGDQLHDGAAAFAAMWRAIPLLRPLGLLARMPPVLWLMERAYCGFLRVRPRISGWLAKREAET